MKVIFGDFGDFSGFDFNQLDDDYDDVAAAQQRLLACRRRDVSPEMNDLKTVIAGAWRRIRELGDPLDAEGDRLYVLSFEGGVKPYVKIGRTATLKERIVEHERTARIQFSFLFDAWVSQPCPDAYPWEQRVLARVETLNRVTRMNKEYFYDLPFAVAVMAAEMEHDR